MNATFKKNDKFGYSILVQIQPINHIYYEEHFATDCRKKQAAGK